MNREQLVELARAAAKTPSRLKEEHPEAFAVVSEKAAAKVKEDVINRLPDATPEVVAAIRKADIDVSQADLTGSLVAALSREGVPAPQIKRVTDALLEAPVSPAPVTTPLDLDRPLDEQLLVRDEVDRGRMLLVAAAAGLDNSLADRLADAVPAPVLLSDERLTALVSDGHIEPRQAHAIGLTSTLSHLLGGDIELAARVRERLEPRVGDSDGIIELLKLAPLDWTTVMREAGAEPTEGTTLEDRGAAIARQLAVLFPGDALASRLIPGGVDEVTSMLRNDGDRAVSKLAGRFPGLQLAEIGDDPGLSVKEKAQRISDRIAVLERVRQLNPDVELLSLDYTAPDLSSIGLKLDGIAVEDQRAVTDTLKAHQRVHTITGEATVSRALLEAGFHSAVDVARERYQAFQSRTGLAADVAQEIFEESYLTAEGVTGTFGGVMDLINGGFGYLNYANLSPEIDDYLRRLTGYAELFGNQAYCSCSHCQSIMSPAAYFCDLMMFVEENVSAPNFAQRADHPLHLRTRREDLWKSPLTCEATNTTLPMLDVINEVLENYVARADGFTGSITDRDAVTKEVYETILSQRIFSSRQPFTLPLVRLEAYLDNYKLSRGDLVERLGATGYVRTEAILTLSLWDWQLVTSPDTSLTVLRRVFDLPLEQAAGSATFTPFDVQDLVTAINQSRAEVGDLLLSRFVAASGTAPRIVPEKTNSDSVQNDIERVRDLTPAALDRAYRMLRLWRHVPWTLPELDLALSQVGTTVLLDTELAKVAELRALQRRLGTPLDETCALVGSIPTRATDDRPPQFDRLFNARPFVVQGGSLPSGDTFVHPAFRDAPSAGDVTQQRLQAALGVGDAALLQLLRALTDQLGADLDATVVEDRGFVVSAQNLSSLYRHARLANLLGINVPDLFRLLELAPGVVGDWVDEIGDVQALLDLHSWLTGSGWTLDDLAVITRRTPVDPKPYRVPSALARQVLGEVAAAGATVFADTVFAFLQDMTEESSRKLVAANTNRIVALADGSGFQVPDNADLTTPLTVPTGINVDEPKARAVLADHDVREAILRRLAAALGATADTIRGLLKLLAVNLSDLELHKMVADTKQPTELIDVITDLLPLRVLFRSPVFDGPTLDWVAANTSGFEINDVRDLGINAARAVRAYESFARSGDPGADPEDNSLELQHVLEAFGPTSKFDTADPAELAKVLRTEAGLVSPLQSAVSLPDNGLAALERLRGCVEMAQLLSVGGDALARTGSDEYGDLNSAADAILAGLRAQFSSDQWADQIEPLEDNVRSAKRDALVDHLLTSAFPQFTRPRDLYDYFLLDVEVEGCVRTSRVVAATGSVQLYINRVLMDLEQDRRDPFDINRVHVSPGDVPADEWDWRKNYRVWEANRKVFLWPENYIEPELRDDKSPLFAELEANLLQQPITEQNVLDAYATYLSGFEDLAKMQIAGSFHEKSAATKTDTLHLFGVTHSDPGVYYYRTAINAHYGVTEAGRGTRWTPWRKLDVQIPVRKVSPVVIDSRLYVFWIEYITKPTSTVIDGKSLFTGYTHTASVKYTMLRLDGQWTAPQRLSAWNLWPDIRGDSILDDPRVMGSNFTTNKIRYDNGSHNEAQESYTLRGLRWERTYPWFDSENRFITTIGIDRSYNVDLFERRIYLANWSRAYRNGTRLLHSPASTPRYLYEFATSYTADYDAASQWLDRWRVMSSFTTSDQPVWDWLQNRLSTTSVLKLTKAANLDIVNGSVSDVLIDDAGDQFLLQGSVRETPTYLLRRIGTTLAPKMSRLLFTEGVGGLLDLSTQRALVEALPRLTGYNDVEDAVVTTGLDFNGAYGNYFREIFFHVPFLIANHLNSNQRFQLAQRWYKYIFDPTADEHISQSFPPDVRAKLQLDRVWRYLEFRNLDVPTMRKVLTDESAIEAYRNDPFNPYAIARLRISAFQKTIVMKYVDNLLDWGDSLFTEFTMESVNEATMMYSTAAAILGRRPPALGSCGEGNVKPKNYETIGPLLKVGSEFLAELETWTIGRQYAQKSTRLARQKTVPKYALAAAKLAFASEAAASTASSAAMALAADAAADGTSALASHFDWKRAGIESWGQRANKTVATMDNGATGKRMRKSTGRFGWQLIRTVSPVFCVPENDTLLSYWDRVEDRLFKIRNCRDITGAKRELSLFAPEIDPRMLVRARAAGLSLDDILGATSGSLPPYRFAYLIERAKAHAAAVQSFGSALLGSLEKKDAEELNLLRSVQQGNLLGLATRLRQWEVDAAQDGIETLELQQTAAEYRRDYYDALSTENLSETEHAQSDARMAASGLEKAAAILDTVASIVHLIPQLGSPFAMKFGGLELGQSATSWSDILRDIARAFEADASAAGLRAGFERRQQGWDHQAVVAQHEIDALSKQAEAMRLRKQMAERSQQIHDVTIAQQEEVHTFLKERFAGQALYTFLASTLQRLYRDAYTSAYAMARLTEQAFRFERDDQVSTLLQPSYWDSAHVGLFAGERLLADLNTMERRFLETNTRTLEVDQPFALSQVAPDALVRLRESGTCEFDLPELFFDLFYPGHYRRRIRAVRLTVACVTGPYTNISATLTLLRSSVRTKPTLDASSVLAVPVRRSASIAASTAQQDAGVFELSFRDERYMPFEGAGAVSRWRLSLPSGWRPFDYRTMNDVILHVMYGAEADEVLRGKVEERTTLVVGSLRDQLAKNSLFRVVSLRQEMSGAFQRLMHNPTGTDVRIRLGTELLPMFLQGGPVTTQHARLVVVPARGVTLGAAQLRVDGQVLSGFSADTTLGGLPFKSCDAQFSPSWVGEHTLAVVAAGGLDVTNREPGDTSAIDPAKLEDILLVLEYRT